MIFNKKYFVLYAGALFFFISLQFICAADDVDSWLNDCARAQGWDSSPVTIWRETSLRTTFEKGENPVEYYTKLFSMLKCYQAKEEAYTKANSPNAAGGTWLSFKAVHSLGDAAGIPKAVVNGVTYNEFKFIDDKIVACGDEVKSCVIPCSSLSKTDWEAGGKCSDACWMQNTACQRNANRASEKEFESLVMAWASKLPGAKGVNKADGMRNDKNSETEQIQDGVFSRLLNLFGIGLGKSGTDIDNSGSEKKLTPEELKNKQELMGQATEAYSQYVAAYNRYNELISKGELDEADEALKLYNKYYDLYVSLNNKINKGEFSSAGAEIESDKAGEETALDKLEKDPYIDTKRIGELKEFVGDSQTYADNIKDVLEVAGKTEEELEGLEKFSENLEDLGDEIENIKRGTEVWNIIMTDGPTQDWREVTYDQAKAGWWTGMKRGTVGFFNLDKRAIKEAEKVQDIYEKMANIKDEQEFYEQSTQQRLVQYAYEKAVEDLSDDVKEKVEDTIKETIGTECMLGAKAMIASINVFGEEQKKPLIGNYYLSYVEYRNKAGSHEQALAQMKVMSDDDAGLIVGDRWGVEQLINRPYWGVDDNEVLMQAFNQLYKSEHLEEK